MGFLVRYVDTVSKHNILCFGLLNVSTEQVQIYIVLLHFF